MTDDIAGSVAAPLSAGSVATPAGWWRSAVRWFVGPAPVGRLTITHCVHSAAEAFFTVSMAGSIFFSVSPDAARSRVLLFLVLALAPFLVMAPLVGPVVDRVRGGLPTTMVATFVVRAGLALLLAENLRTLFLFPLAFGVLVVAKTYTVSRNALVPSLVADQDDLVAANARLSRSATIAGGVAAALAVLVYTNASGGWALRVAAVVYVAGAVSAWRVRAVATPIEPLEQVAMAEMVQPDVSGAVWDMVVLRAAIGFALFHFGFSLRSDGDPAWVIGAVILANGTGGFVGTVVSPTLRRRLSERSMFTVALVAPAMATSVAGVAFNRYTLFAAIFVLGLSVSIGRRALDATIQREAPHARRGEVYASLETRLELAWVTAACLAVALRVATWVGVLALAAFLAGMAYVHFRRHSGLGVLRPIATRPLPERLVMRADVLADHHLYDEAVAVALAALDGAADVSAGESAGESAGNDAVIDADERRALLAGDLPVDAERARRVIDRVRARVNTPDAPVAPVAPVASVASEAAPDAPDTPDVA